MFDFLKRLYRAVYHFTIGGAVRCYKNTKAKCVDYHDKRWVGRTLTYVGFIFMSMLFPSAIVVIGILRVLMIIDIMSTLGDIFQYTANSYADQA